MSSDPATIDLLTCRCGFQSVAAHLSLDSALDDTLASFWVLVESVVLSGTGLFTALPVEWPRGPA